MLEIEAAVTKDGRFFWGGSLADGHKPAGFVGLKYPDDYFVVKLSASDDGRTLYRVSGVEDFRAYRRCAEGLISTAGLIFPRLADFVRRCRRIDKVFRRDLFGVLTDPDRLYCCITGPIAFNCSDITGWDELSACLQYRFRAVCERLLKERRYSLMEAAAKLHARLCVYDGYVFMHYENWFDELIVSHGRSGHVFKL